MSKRWLLSVAVVTIAAAAVVIGSRVLVGSTGEALAATAIRVETGGERPVVRNQPPGSGTLALALRVFLRGSRLELESDEPLVADHPRVVAGLDDVHLARTDLDLGAILVPDGQPASIDNPDMAGLAALSSGHGLDTF
jgi:hypothetical protein